MAEKGSTSHTPKLVSGGREASPADGAADKSRPGRLAAKQGDAKNSSGNESHAADELDSGSAALSMADIAKRLGLISHEMSSLYQNLIMETSERTEPEDTTDGGCEVGNSTHLEGLLAAGHRRHVGDLYNRAKHQARNPPSHNRASRRPTDVFMSSFARPKSPDRFFAESTIFSGVSTDLDSSGDLTKSNLPSRSRSRSRTMLHMRKHVKNPAESSKWSTISSLPASITFCHPGTQCYNDVLLVCGRGVQKPGAAEKAMLWEVSLSEYTTLNWEEANLPPVKATDCVSTFFYNGSLHVVLLSEEGAEHETPHQVLSVWRRGSIRKNAFSSHSSVPEDATTLQRTRIFVSTKKRNSATSQEMTQYEWKQVCERKWQLYQFTTVHWSNRLVFAGGRSGAGRSSNVIVLNLDAPHDWQDWPTLPECVSGAVGVVWRDQLLLVGGQTGKGLGATRTHLLALDLDTTQSRMWYSTSYAELEQGGCGAMVLQGEVLIVAGSKDATHQAGDDVFMLSDDGRFWYSLPSLSCRRSSPVLALIGNCLLCFCGESGPSLRTSIESFDLSYFGENGHVESP